MTDDIRPRAAQILAEGLLIRQRLAETCLDATIDAARAIHSCLGRGGKVLFFGNGGSAADAQHLAAEFVGGLGGTARCAPAIALAADTSIITALGNDYGFDQVFSRQLSVLARPPDVAVAISTSGRSRNILEGIHAAREIGVTTVAMTGQRGTQLASMVDIAIVVPSTTTGRIQECHIAIGHLICEVVELLHRNDPTGAEGLLKGALPAR